MRIVRISAVLLSVLIGAAPTAGAQSTTTSVTKPPITLDEFVNVTEILGAKISPDGRMIAFASDRPLPGDSTGDDDGKGGRAVCG